MFALVESGSITKMLDGNRGITIDGIQHPRAIYTLWTEAERNAIGIYEVTIDTSKKKDEQWYINTNITYAFSGGKVTLGGNRTIGLASGGVAGAFISILVIQDGTGSRTVSWNAAYEFAADTAPTLTTTASKGDLFVFRYNGSKWLEVGRNLALTLS